MSLAYLGPNSDLIDVVSRDAFLEALGNPSLRVRILEQVPTTMEGALRIALNLEALDKSKETKAKAMVELQECAEETEEREEKFVKVAAKSVLAPVSGSCQAEAVPTFADFVERLHADLGHFGQTKTCIAVSRCAYFPGWWSFTALLVRNCKICSLHQWGHKTPRQVALRPMCEFRPFAVLHADLVGPMPNG